MSKRKLPTLDFWVKRHPQAIQHQDKLQIVAQSNIASEASTPAAGGAVQSDAVTDDSENSESNVSCKPGAVQTEESEVFASMPPPYFSGGREFNFKIKWLGDFKWAELTSDGTKLLCKECKSAYKKKVFSPTTTINKCFISDGFGNWQLGASRLRIHERSDQHVDAVTRLDGCKSTSVVTLLSKSAKNSQQVARQALEVLVTSAKYLAKQGLPFRGHTHDSGNFQELIKLRSKDVPSLKSWLEKEKNFTSWKIQNEIIKIFSMKIQRRLMSDLKERKEFCLIVDETTDNSGKEQVSICVRIVNDELCPQELFLGLYEVSSTTADNLKEVILDALKRYNLSIEDLRAQCYDGAKNMSGIHRGVAAQILKLQPLAVYVHCYAHSLNLAVQDTIKQIPMLRDTMSIVHEISVIVRASPKRLAQFKAITSEDEASSGLLPKPMCPTRFLLRARSVRAVLENYSSLLVQLEKLAASNENISTTTHGLSSRLQKGEIYFGMLLCLELMTLLEDLSRSIQRPSSSLGGVLETISIVRTTLRGRGADDAQFEKNWTKMEDQMKELDLEPPQLPRYRKPSAKVQTKAQKRFESAKEMVKHFYQKAHSLAEEEISHRFSQEGIQKYAKIEALLTEKVANTEAFVSSLNSICNTYDLDADRIHTNLKMLNYTEHEFKSVRDLVVFLNGLQVSTRVMYSELVKLVKILLLFPVSSCTSERSFSVLKRLHSYLRTTMSQERLNHCCILSTYREFADEIDIQEVVSEFIYNNDTRANIFGPPQKKIDE